MNSELEKLFIILGQIAVVMFGIILFIIIISILIIAVEELVKEIQYQKNKKEYEKLAKEKNEYLTRMYREMFTKVNLIYQLLLQNENEKRKEKE